MTSLEVTLTTGRTLHQGIGSEKGKHSEQYSEATSTLLMDPKDMKELGIHIKDPVKLKTDEDEVVLRANKSQDAPHEGIVFLPYGPWANKLIGTNTDSQGMPDFKNIPAVVESTSEKPSNLEDLMAEEKSPEEEPEE